MGRITLEQVEQWAMQLPVAEQLELVARISGRLSRSNVADELSPVRNAVSSKSFPPAERAGMSLWEADELLQELDSIAESIKGEFDSGLEIRQIRGGEGEL